MVARTVYPPARLLSVACILATHDNNNATEANIWTGRKMPKYLTAVVELVA